MKYVSLVLLGLLMAVLAGCGGGGDGGKGDMITKLEEQVTMLEGQLKATQDTLSTTKGTLSETQDTLKTTQDELTTAEGRLETTQDTLKTTQNDLTTAKNALKTTEADLKATETELDTAEKSLSTARIDLATRNAELKAEQDKLATAQADLKTAEEALDEAEEDLATRTTELSAAQAALKTAQENSSATETELTNKLTQAQTDLATAQANLQNAQTNLATATTELATVKGQLATANANLNTARNQVVTLQGQVATLQNQVRTLQGQVQQGNQDLQDQLDEAEQAEVNARAGAYITAINSGGTARTPAVTVSYKRGSTLQINPGGDFVSGSGAPSISGFTPRTYTRQVGVSGKQTVYLYTNIQAAGTRAFWKIHGLEITTGAEDQSAYKPTPTAAAYFVTSTTDNTQATGVKVSGRFDGVSGTFTCTTSDCIGAKSGITLTNLVGAPVDGVRSFGANGDWTFKPTSITSGVQQDEDTEHLYFGIWVEEPNVASNPHTYQYIEGGSVALTDVSTLSGTAKFSGGAVGKYVTRNQVGENAKIGTFTAAANFTATLGSSPTLEGRITGFKDGSRSLTGWSVYLGGSGNQPVTLTSGAVTNGTASALIGGVSATGQWDAALRGRLNNSLGHAPSADPNPRDLTKYSLTSYPLADLAGLVGNFHATSNDTATLANAAIAGTFAATPK